MKFNYSDVSSKYGAPMGRRNNIQNADQVTQIYIEQVPMIDGDYDPGGAYWGGGVPLFVGWGTDEEEEQVCFLRAADWAEARMAFKEIFPNAREVQSNAEFLTAYIEAALWSSLDANGEPLDDNYTIQDLAPETLDKFEDDCAEFLSKTSELIGSRLSQAGHDFWLTRNGHGCGFWDGDWEEGEKLTAAAKSFGGVDLYVGDDGKIYQG